MRVHDCKHHGHIWVERDTGLPYVRHRGRAPGTVHVKCQFCPATAELETFAAFTGGHGTKVPTDIPPQFQAVLDRLPGDDTNTGPVSTG